MNNETEQSQDQPPEWVNDFFADESKGEYNAIFTTLGNMVIQ